MLGTVNLDWRAATRRIVAQVRAAAGPLRPAGPDDEAAEAHELQRLGADAEEAEPPLPPPAAWPHPGLGGLSAC
eukprot:5308901-Lingulodinium_polyedra.AAC.1